MCGLAVSGAEQGRPGCCVSGGQQQCAGCRGALFWWGQHFPLGRARPGTPVVHRSPWTAQAPCHLPAGQSPQILELHTLNESPVVILKSSVFGPLLDTVLTPEIFGCTFLSAVGELILYSLTLTYCKKPCERLVNKEGRT